MYNFRSRINPNIDNREENGSDSDTHDSADDSGDNSSDHSFGVTYLDRQAYNPQDLEDEPGDETHLDEPIYDDDDASEVFDIDDMDYIDDGAPDDEVGDNIDDDFLLFRANRRRRQQYIIIHNIRINDNILVPIGTQIEVAVPLDGITLRLAVNIPDENGLFQRIREIPDHFFQQRSTRLVLFHALFVGDGVHFTNSPETIGIGLRSTEFVFLIDLLCNVVGLTYVELTLIPVESIHSFNSGLYGHVRWVARSPQFARFFDTTGFPSSNILDSNRRLMEEWLPFIEENRLWFAVWILGFTIADGSVIHAWSGNPDQPTSKLYFIELKARDQGLVEWMRQGLIFYGCNVSPITTAERQGRRNISYVRIYPTQNGMELLRLGLQQLIEEDITLPGKLRILAEYLARFRLPECVLHPRFGQRQEFPAFVQRNTDPGLQVANNPLALVLAQDFYPLNLYSVNNLLVRGFGFRAVTSIWDYQVSTLLTTLQEARLDDWMITPISEVLKYVYMEHLMTRTVTDTGPLGNGIADVTAPFVICADCNTIMLWRGKWNHAQMCIATRFDVVPVALGQTNSSDLARVPGHLLLDRTPAPERRFICPGLTCVRTYNGTTQLYKHAFRHYQTQQQIDDARIICPFPNCNSLNKDRANLARHISRHHGGGRNATAYAQAGEHEAQLIDNGAPIIPYEDRPQFAHMEHIRRVVARQTVELFGVAIYEGGVEEAEAEELTVVEQRASLDAPRVLYPRIPHENGPVRLPFPMSISELRQHFQWVRQTGDSSITSPFKSRDNLFVPCVYHDCTSWLLGPNSLKTHLNRVHYQYGTEVTHYANEVTDEYYLANGFPGYQQQLVNTRGRIANLIGASVDGFIDN
ncbi:unnamed protein product [Absidia cylindrospora]